MKNSTVIMSIILCIILVATFAACAGNSTPPESNTPDTNRPTYEGTSNLVVYFSQPDNVDDSTLVINGETLGNTQYMAYVIQENTGANIFRIIPETPYPINHSELVDLASDEKSSSARPAIKDSIENFEQYDTVFVGYPNWWGDMPMILYTLFDTYDFSGKTIIPFNTHGGSGFSSTISTIRNLEPNATVYSGLSISRNRIQDAEQEIINWVIGLGFEKPISSDNSNGGQSKILIVYFPYGGNTEQLANYLTQKTKGKVVEIVAEVPYTAVDTNYSSDNTRCEADNFNLLLAKIFDKIQI